MLGGILEGGGRGGRGGGGLPAAGYTFDIMFSVLLQVGIGDAARYVKHAVDAVIVEFLRCHEVAFSNDAIQSESFLLPLGYCE